MCAFVYKIIEHTRNTRENSKQFNNLNPYVVELLTTRGSTLLTYLAIDRRNEAAETQLNAGSSGGGGGGGASQTARRLSSRTHLWPTCISGRLITILLVSQLSYVAVRREASSPHLVACVLTPLGRHCWLRSLGTLSTPAIRQLSDLSYMSSSLTDSNPQCKGLDSPFRHTSLTLE